MKNVWMIGLLLAAGLAAANMLPMDLAPGGNGGCGGIVTPTATPTASPTASPEPTATPAPQVVTAAAAPVNFGSSLPLNPPKCEDSASAKPSKKFLALFAVYPQVSYKTLLTRPGMYYDQGVGQGFVSTTSGYAIFGLGCDARSGLNRVALWKFAPDQGVRCQRNAFMSAAFWPWINDYAGECK